MIDMNEEIKSLYKKRDEILEVEDERFKTHLIAKSFT
jgi:hypothetical protein